MTRNLRMLTDAALAYELRYVATHPDYQDNQHRAMLMVEAARRLDGKPEWPRPHPPDPRIGRHELREDD